MELEVGKKLLKKKQYKEAELFFLNELERGNKSSRLYFFLGLTYFELNQFEKSINFYKSSLKIDPKSTDVMINLANVQLTIGNVLSAKSLYLKIIKLDKYNTRAYYGLYSLKPKFLDIKFYSDIFQIRNNKKVDLYESSLVDFLLSKQAKIKGDYKLELDYLNKHHIQCFRSNNNYNLQGLFYYSKIISKHYNKIKFENLKSKDLNKNDIFPIFIVGLPRSGSTLIESILTSGDDKVYSLGETSIINLSILEQIEKFIFKKNFNLKKFRLTLDFEKLYETIYNKYNNYLDIKKKKIIFVDKSLENFFNIEIILKIFPNAKFIHSKRNYKDSVIAIYQSILPFLPWTHSITDIINYTNNYIEILNHFENKYSEKILTINLEDLTNKQIECSKKIFDFCKLSWSPEILKFYERQNLNVKTLSNIQVREQISKYNSMKYSSYYPLLSKFKEKFSWLES